MKNIILTAQNGLRTQFDASQIKFKKTFKKAKKLGIELNKTTEFIKKDGIIWKIHFIKGNYKGRYWEEIYLIPYLELKKK